MVYMAQDSDFEKNNGCWVYRGQEKEVEIPEYINGELVTSTAFMFAQTGSYWSTTVTKIVLKHSQVNNMEGMFSRDNKAEKENLDLSTFNTSNVNNMNSMFRGFNNSSELLDLSSFNTSNVIDMGYMFSNCKSETINVSSFNTSNVRNMGYMFEGCSALRTIDVSGFNTSNVNDFSQMFGSCSRLEELDLSNFVLKDGAETKGMLNIYNSNLKIYIASKEDIPKFRKNAGFIGPLQFHVIKKYLDFEGLKIYNEKVKEEIKNSGQGLAVEIVNKEQIGETQNNSIIFVRK